MVKTQNERIGADSGLCRCREYKLSSITICPHFLPENTSYTPSLSTSCVARCCVCCPYALLTQNAPQSSAFLGQGRSLHRLGFTPKMGTNPPVPVNPHHSSSSPPSAFFAFGCTSRSKPDRPSFTLPQPLISNCSRECARCDFGWGTLVRASHRTGTLCGRGVWPRTAVAPPATASHRG